MSAAASLLIATIGLTGRSNTAGPPGGQDPGVGDEGGLLGEIRSAADSGADLILLPQLSFSPYFPAHRDREALELGERFPSAHLSAAREAAGESWLAATGYECVGEGAFYVRGELGTAGEGCLLAQRQHRVEAAEGRYEQMFISPGHGARSVAETPWAPTGLLVGADAREPDAWAELAGLGATLLLAAVSETEEAWATTCRIAGGLATVHGVALAMVNRGPAPDEPQFSGGSLVLDPDGRSLTAGENGHFSLELPATDKEEAL